MKNNKKYPVLYCWDIGSGDEADNAHMYAVEYRGKADSITWEERERAIDKARRKAFEITGKRKCFMLSNDGFEPYSGSTEKIVRVPLATKPLKKWEGKQRKPLATMGDEDYGDDHDMYDIEYRDFLEVVQERMGDHGYWRIDGRNLDWLHHNGSKVIRADKAEELLRAFYSEGLMRLYCGKRRDQFEINAPTHDTPMGSFYYFTPISERTYNAEV